MLHIFVRVIFHKTFVLHTGTSHSIAYQVSAMWHRCSFEELFIPNYAKITTTFSQKKNIVIRYIIPGTIVMVYSLKVDEKVWYIDSIRPINRLYLETIHIYLYVYPGVRVQSSYVHYLDACIRQYKLYNKPHLTIYVQQYIIENEDIFALNAILRHR